MKKMEGFSCAVVGGCWHGKPGLGLHGWFGAHHWPSLVCPELEARAKTNTNTEQTQNGEAGGLQPSSVSSG